MDRVAFEAGAVVRDTPEAAAEPYADEVVARTWRHGALPGRAVVRLVSRPLAVGADAEAAVCGFSPAEPSPVVGRQRRRALGFPQWTLVHEPRHSALALSVVPRFRAIVRTVASKPGHARDAFVELARTFERKAPSVLPTFHEQVARGFVEAGNLKLAATFFDKARAAEQAYGLRPDPARTAEVFLEFALAGAVTVKSIQAWVQEVAAADGAAEALERFHALAVGRTQGGLPPWAAFAKDLARLAAAAKVPAVEAQARFLREVVGAPALDRMAASVWKDLSPAVVHLAGDAAFVDALARRFPKGDASRWGDVDEDFAAEWLSLLRRVGALDPARRGAEWLGRFLDWCPDAFGPALQVVRAFAEVGRGAGVVLRRDWVDPDVLDLLLTLGVPVTLEEGADLTLRGWAAGTEVPAAHGWPAEERPRALEALLADPTHRETLLRLVPRVLSEEGFAAVARARPPIAAMRLDALRALLARIAAGPLPAAEDAFSDLEDVPVDDVRGEPALADALASLSVAPALAASLRGGVLEERGWPAFEAAVAELGADETAVAGPWPNVVVSGDRAAIVLGPDGERLGRFDLSVPKRGRVRAARFLDGQLLVGLSTEDGEQAYWSGAPADRFDADVPWWSRDVVVGIPVAGGGVLLGERVVHAGDRAWPDESEALLWDGEAAWRRSAAGLRRVDPGTGRSVDGPPPSFLADVPADHADSAFLAWLPGGPLGLRTCDGEVWETLDGHTWRGDDTPDWVGAWPGDGAARAVRSGWRELALHGPDGAVVDEAPSAGRLPAHLYWRTVPRDPAASAALRALGTAEAEALLAGVPVDDDVAAAAAVSALVPAVAPLAAGVARQVIRARALAERLAAWRDGASGGDDEAPAHAPTLRTWSRTLGYAAPRGLWGSGDLARAMREEGAFLAGATDAPPVTSGGEHWRFADGIRAVAFALWRPALPDDERAKVRAVLEAWCALPPIPVRIASWSFPDLTSSFLKTKVEDGERNLLEDWTVVTPTARFVVHTDDTWSDEGPFDVETRQAGEGDPPGATLSQATVHPPPAPVDVAWVRALLAADPRREALPAEDVAAVAAATGLSPEASALLLTAGGPSEQRAALGFGEKALEAGGQELHRLDDDALRRVLAEAAPDDPSTPPSAARLAERFVAAFGVRVPVPSELRIAADKALDSDAILDLLSTPDATPGLTADAEYAVDADLTITVGGGRPAFDADIVADLVKGVPWAMAQLRGGDPLRANLARVLDHALARLSHPGLWVDGGSTWEEGKALRKWIADLPGEGDRRSVPGLRVAVVDDDQLVLILAPATFGDEGRAAVAALAARAKDPELCPLAQTLAYVPRLRAWREHLRTDPLPAGACAADPRVSAPATVAAAVAALRLPEDAVVAYLQLLAFPNPTKKELCAWNGWTPKVHDRAMDALVAAKKVLEAKRPRAGRAHFLPGAWVDAKPVPYERWKVPLLDGTEKRGAITLPFGDAVLAWAPHEAFPRAWARIATGDVPAFG
jgi:hypothetical protein